MMPFLKELLLELLYPRKCIFCGRLLKKGQTDLCRKCTEQAPMYSEDSENKKSKIPFLDSVTAVWYYEDKVRKSLHRYKFRNGRFLAESYGRFLAMRLLQQGIQDVDYLTWVPVSEKRKRRRGYDQAQLLAQAVGMQLGIQPICLLKKVRDNPPQSGLSGAAERKANVLGVYELIPGISLEQKTVMILDDILTTGSTLGACARVLRSAGAKSVQCAVVAAVRYRKNNK